MQGMIADTGGDWKLFEQHRTFGMILDWVFNPFGHLRGGHHGMHALHAGMAMPGGAGEAATRRLIFMDIEGVPAATPADLFAINAVRVPAFMADVDVHNLKLLEVKDLAAGAGGGRCRPRCSEPTRVPTRGRSGRACRGRGPAMRRTGTFPSGSPPSPPGPRGSGSGPEDG